MKRWGRWTLWIVLLGLAAAGIVYAFLPKPVDVDLATVTRGPLQVTVDEDGRTRIKEKYIVSSPVGGQLVRINLKAGDPIAAGKTILATIRPSDPTILDARQVAEAEARVAAARVTIERAGARKGQAEAAKELAESQYARAKQLFDQESLSQNEFDAALAVARQRTEELRAATFDQEIAQFELQQAEAALLRVQPEGPGTSSPDAAAAEKATRNFEIASPIDGNVLRVLQESATVVQPGTELLEVGNRTDLEIVIDVLSTDAVKIQSGAEVWLEHWGGDSPLRANVRRIEPAAFTKISALGVEEQRVNVVADFNESPERLAALGDGFRVEAKIVTWKGSSVLRIPASAPFRIGADWYVYCNVEGRARRTKVELGHRNPLEAEIVGGLNEGEQIVAYPDDRIREGVQLIDRRLRGSSSLGE